MSIRFFKHLVTSRLLRPVFIVLLVAGLIQVVVSQWLISNQVERLVETAGTALVASSNNVSASFGETREDVRGRLERMRQKTTDELSAELTRQQTEQQERVAGNVRTAVMAEAQGLADVLAAVAAPLIWDRDIPRLTDLVELADARDSVLLEALNIEIESAEDEFSLKGRLETGNYPLVTGTVKVLGVSLLYDEGAYTEVENDDDEDWRDCSVVSIDYEQSGNQFRALGIECEDDD